MPSPFPGMDPFIEGAISWRGFHTQMVVEMSRVLVRQVRPKYFAATEESLFIHEPSAHERRELTGVADSMVALEAAPAATRGNGSAAGLAVAEPPVRAILPPEVSIEKHRYITIRDTGRCEVVTVIELLSPTNKRGEGRVRYERQRRELLASDVHFVEIDLLRGGRKMVMGSEIDSPYCAMVSRAEERPRVGVWPIGLRDRLPTIPVPLRSPDPDAALDLQVVLDEVYDKAGYSDVLYRDEPDPPLTGEDAAWAREVLALPTDPPGGGG